MRIDVHAHIFSRPYVEAATRVFGNDRSPSGQDAMRIINWMNVDPRMTDLDLRLEEMDKYGIQMQVLSPPFHGVLLDDQGAARELTLMANDTLVEAARRYPDRFRALPVLPLQFPDLAVQELDRIAGRPEVSGVAIMASAGSKAINDPSILPVYAELERRRMPFLLHPISPPGLDCMLELSLANIVGFMFETTLAATRLVYGGVFERHRDLEMVFPHLGGAAPYIMGRVQWGYERFPICSENLSMPPEEYFKRFYYDTVCRNVPALRMALSMFGADHVLFGSDIPFREDIDAQIQDLKDLNLSEQDLAAIESGNAARVFKIKV